jgi:hypothetical protein
MTERDETDELSGWPDPINTALMPLIEHIFGFDRAGFGRAQGGNE